MLIKGLWDERRAQKEGCFTNDSIEIPMTSKCFWKLV
jgi:hypothetical protein